MSDLNVRNAESAVLTAYAQWQRFLQKFMAQWTEPLQDAVLVRLWDNLDPGMKAQMKQANPEAFKQVDDKITSLRGG